MLTFIGSWGLSIFIVSWLTMIIQWFGISFHKLSISKELFVIECSVLLASVILTIPSIIEQRIYKQKTTIGYWQYRCNERHITLHFVTGKGREIAEEKYDEKTILAAKDLLKFFQTECPQNNITTVYMETNLLPRKKSKAILKRLHLKRIFPSSPFTWIGTCIAHRRNNGDLNLKYPWLYRRDIS